LGALLHMAPSKKLRCRIVLLMLVSMEKRKKRPTRKIVTALQRIDTDIDQHLGRMDQMQRELDAQSEQLALLAARAEAQQARIDALLQVAL
jgi:flagellar capping protein FliD